MNKERKHQAITAIIALLLGLLIMNAVPTIDGVTGRHPKELNRGVAMQVFAVERLPAVDQEMIKRGLCPWCVERLQENGLADKCPGCGDEFAGSLTIDD